MILRLLEAQPRGGHKLYVAFNDGTRKIVDVAPLLQGPMFEQLHDPTVFARVALDQRCGTVVWPNGADLAPEALRALAALEETAAA